MKAKLYKIRKANKSNNLVVHIPASLGLKAGDLVAWDGRMLRKAKQVYVLEDEVFGESGKMHVVDIIQL